MRKAASAISLAMAFSVIAALYCFWPSRLDGKNATNASGLVSRSFHAQHLCRWQCWLLTAISRKGDRQERKSRANALWLIKLDVFRVLGVMPDINPFYQEDYVFGDIRGMIADPLQIAGHEDEIDRRGDHGWVALHDPQQFVIDRIPQIVHLIVRKQDGVGQIRIAVYKRIQALEEHGLHERRHFRNIDHRLNQRMMHQR